MTENNSSEAMQYPNSNMQDKQLGVDQSGDNWQYPSAASSGFVEVEVPSLPGDLNPTESLHARDFGPHVVKQLERSMQRGYMKSGPQQSPAQVFRHYTVVAKGSGLMDSAAIGRMESLASEFEKEPEREAYFEMVLKPWLHSLAPRRR